jgi:predicted patatin/cPLA2 family phospholipase
LKARGHHLNIDKTSLVLEGGAMRGSFTAGVITFFLEKKIVFPYVIGVSAGASNALNYVSKQQERARVCFVDIADNPEYFGIKHFIKGNGLFNTKFLYDLLPMKVLPYDYNEFFACDTFFKLGAVHAKSASMRYWEKKEIKTARDLNLRLQASSSMPVLMPVTMVDGEDYVDGGVVDSIPIDEAIRDGNKRHIVVLTQRKGYRKKQQKLSVLGNIWLRGYPKLRKAICDRHIVYNKTIEKIENFEKEGRIFIIRPDRDPVSRIETNVNKLNEFYSYGYKHMTELLPQLMKFLER